MASSSMSSLFSVRTFNKISRVGLTRFPPDMYQVASELANPDSILLRSHKLKADDVDDSVKAIARCGAGVNNIPVDAMSERGVVVFNTPGSNANAVQELALAGILLSARDIYQSINWSHDMDQSVEQEQMNKTVEEGKKIFGGAEIRGKTLGVIGLGNIGRRLVDTAISMGMKVQGYDPVLTVENAVLLNTSMKNVDSMQSLLQSSDYVSLHVPFMPATKHIMGPVNLGYLGKNTTLLNLSRGELVDNDELLKLYGKGHKGKYVTDFPAKELLGHEHVIPMPHLGASTAEAEEMSAQMAADEVRDYLEHGIITNSVNFPTCKPVKIADPNVNRVAIVNANNPGVLAGATGALSESGCNITDIISSARDSVAYQVLDFEGNITPSLINSLKTIPDVKSVRVVYASA